MDAAGKDSAIKHVLSGINPQGCQVASFRQPSHEELSHDFLWRVHAKLPLRGQIGVFNRSYYEEVLIARIHRELLERQRLPRAVFNPEKIWAERQADIRWFESYLERQGTRVVKFFLHISPEEQRRRLIARLQNPRKRWKFDPGDARERSFWADYQSAYESCIANTHAKTAPWYVIPADNKRNARLLISKITLDALQGLDLELPRIGRERKSELARIERALSRKKRNEKCP
jgi:PPK2 family polyphosphate:nucleotide phosphotransferase